MKKFILLLLFSFLKTCYGMQMPSQHPALPDKIYEEFATKFLESFERFGSREKYYPRLKNKIETVLLNCSVQTEQDTEKFTKLLDPIQLTDVTTIFEDDLTGVFTAQFIPDVKKLMNQAMRSKFKAYVFELLPVDRQRDFKKISLNEWKAKVKEHYTDNQLIIATMQESKKYAEMILELINAND